MKNAEKKIVLGTPLEGEKLLDCFSSAETNPMFRGIMSVIDAQMMDDVQLAAQPDIPDKETFMLLGGTKKLMDLKLELLNIADESKKRESE